MAAQTGIAGSTKIGSGCYVGGQVGIGGHITIGEKTQIGAQSGIISNTEANSKIMGSPAIPVNTFMRASIVIEKLPELYRMFNNIQKEIDSLKKQIQ